MDVIGPLIGLAVGVFFLDRTHQSGDPLRPRDFLRETPST